MKQSIYQITTVSNNTMNFDRQVGQILERFITHLLWDTFWDKYLWTSLEYAGAAHIANLLHSYKYHES